MVAGRMSTVICFRNSRMSLFCVLVVWCYVISVGHGQDIDEDEEDNIAAQLFELQRVVPNSERNEVMVKNHKMAKQYFQISVGNPFLQGNVPIKMDKEEEESKEKDEKKMVYEINPENPFLQQFFANPQPGVVNRGQTEVSTVRPRRTSTQRVTTSTSRRPVSRITTTTPSSTTYRQIPGLMLYLSPTIEETKKNKQPALHTSRPVLGPRTSRPAVPRGTTGSPIIGSFLPKTNPNIVNVFQRFGEPGPPAGPPMGPPVGPPAGPPVESTVEQPLVSDEELEEKLFGNYEPMRLAPKLFVSHVEK